MMTQHSKDCSLPEKNKKKKLKRVINGKTYYYTNDYQKMPVNERDELEKRIADRTCLKCDEKFKSESKFNRICKKCKSINDSYDFQG